MNLKMTWGLRLFHLFNYSILSVFALLCMYPFYYIFIYTISSPDAAGRGKVTLLPIEPTLSNYILMLQNDGILSAFTVSLSRTIIGTLLSVFLSALFAYVLTHKQTPFRSFMYRVTIASMYLNAGLIPWFLVMKAYGLNNSFLLYVLPGSISAYFVLLVKVYIEQLPASLEESAIIDGAGYFTVFLKIIIPLSMPVLAAIGVFAAVGQWNSWFDNMILVDNPNLQTLQYLLWRVLNQSEALAQAMQRLDTTNLNKLDQVVITPMSIKMTITMIVTLPILLVYPFMQRFFVKGIMLGAVKG